MTTLIVWITDSFKSDAPLTGTFRGRSGNKWDIGSLLSQPRTTNVSNYTTWLHELIEVAEKRNNDAREYFAAGLLEVH